MDHLSFFAKYPYLNECWESPDGKAHFTRHDADLHSRIRDLSGKTKKLVRPGTEEPKKIRKTNKTP